jgi:hypothetical protein
VLLSVCLGKVLSAIDISYRARAILFVFTVQFTSDTQIDVGLHEQDDKSKNQLKARDSDLSGLSCQGLKEISLEELFGHLSSELIHGHDQEDVFFFITFDPLVINQIVIVVQIYLIL